MKIYINHFNLQIVNEIQELFIKQLVNTATYIQLFTNESMYQIENNNIYCLEPIDKDIKMYENYYDELTLIVDSSYFKKTLVSSIYGNKHCHTIIVKNVYQLDKNSKIKMVIENWEGSANIKSDIYFESDTDVDINDQFIKKEISEFLSHFK